jgi:tRNA pseudouridine55 synthase
LNIRVIAELKKIKMEAGFLFLKKPAGITSHDVVAKLREISGVPKIGHSGTLDPFAEGLLILGVGRQFTKKLSLFQKKDKEYLAKIKLGFVSNTFDRTGQIKEITIKKKPSLEEVLEVLKSFETEFEQTPPLFSAKKIKGKKLYELARKGLKIKPKPQKVKIYRIELLNYQFPYLTIRVRCSAGTYIRSLANDIGEKLKCGAYLEELLREKIGELSLKDAVSLSELNEKNWKSFLRKI